MLKFGGSCFFLIYVKIWWITINKIMFKMAILNVILLGLNFFFLIYEKKIENRSSEARPTILWGERSEPQSALGERSEQKSPPAVRLAP